MQIEDLFSLDYLYNNARPMLSPKEDEDMLKEKDIYYVPWLDLLIHYYIHTGHIEEKHYDGYVYITNGYIKTVKADKDELYKRAVQNITEQAVYKTMEEALADVLDMSSPIPEKSSLPMMVLTVHNNNYGSAVILSPIMKKLEQFYGDTFAILPSSKHEIITVPFDEKEETTTNYNNMIESVNEQCLCKDDYLSNHVYIYRNGCIS